MTVIDWIRESAFYMADDRPDVYPTIGAALDELTTVVEHVRELDIAPVCVLSFSSYVLVRYVEDDMEEFILARKVSGVALFEDEESCRAYSYTPEVDLPGLDEDPPDMLD